MSTIFSKIVRKQCLHACNFFHVCIVAPSYKLELARFSVQLRIQAGAGCGNIQFLECSDPDSLLLSPNQTSLNSKNISKEIASEKGLEKTGRAAAVSYFPYTQGQENKSLHVTLGTLPKRGGNKSCKVLKFHNEIRYVLFKFQ